jgi:hypothetical protein
MDFSFRRNCLFEKFQPTAQRSSQDLGAAQLAEHASVSETRRVLKARTTWYGESRQASSVLSPCLERDRATSFRERDRHRMAKTSEACLGERSE